mmetsp:Transcript_26212/g.41032  ORF Transcript_26212/g.41032 Transcript_26212/m.41032 type:complete len:94 (-) Transcript_26212:12-293(-)
MHDFHPKYIRFTVSPSGAFTGLSLNLLDSPFTFGYMVNCIRELGVCFLVELFRGPFGFFVLQQLHLPTYLVPGESLLSCCSLQLCLGALHPKF